jgi:hypothetical protein
VGWFADMLNALSIAVPPLANVFSTIRPYSRSSSIGFTIFELADVFPANCLAIRDGLNPALNAARTTFTCPHVKDAAEASTVRRAGGL